MTKDDEKHLIGAPKGLNQAQRDHLSRMLTVRNPPAAGQPILKLSFEEWAKIHQEYEQAQREGLPHDAGYEPFTKYGQHLVLYSDGRPRPRPLRPLLTNEMGMMGDGRIIVLKDKMPGDLGGVQVTVTDNVETKSGPGQLFQKGGDR